MLLNHIQPCSWRCNWYWSTSRCFILGRICLSVWIKFSKSNLGLWSNCIPHEAFILGHLELFLNSWKWQFTLPYWKIFARSQNAGKEQCQKQEGPLRCLKFNPSFPSVTASMACPRLQVGNRTRVLCRGSLHSINQVSIFKCLGDEQIKICERYIEAKYTKGRNKNGRGIKKQN